MCLIWKPDIDKFSFKALYQVPISGLRFFGLFEAPLGFEDF